MFDLPSFSNSTVKKKVEQYGEAKLLEMLGADLSVPLVPVEWNPPVEAGHYGDEDDYEAGGYGDEPQYGYAEYPPPAAYPPQQALPPPQQQQRGKKRPFHTPPQQNGGSVQMKLPLPWGGNGPCLNFPPGPVSTLGLLAMQSGARVQTGVQLQPSLEHGYIVRQIAPPPQELPPTVIQPQATCAQPPQKVAGATEELLAAANKAVNEYRLPEYLTGEGVVLLPTESCLSGKKEDSMVATEICWLPGRLFFWSVG